MAEIAACPGHPASTKPRRRLPAAEREQQIVEAAAQFFAEHGLGGQTRELARELGITHSAIFRYFPSKDALLDRVYEHVYVKRWNPAWTGLVRDRSQPLSSRIIRFYTEYTEQIFDFVWVRIFVFSGLKGYDIAPRYLATIRERVIHPICAEVRADLGLPDPDTIPLTEREIEAAWAMHGKVFYLAIRKFVYGWPIPQNLSQTISDDVTSFLEGSRFIFRDSVRSAGHS
ncbi:TetR/AcrR family transcriptional regulator [Methylobacterium sp. J-070]|uniref:TetR/AcrR family transcriptional regulator n=1 Tax=Methylobacterium sp. J-070 TaxID=2836650 RepID=UPI001FBBCB4C|nr:TetR/AcrR family transcriptional regulator [Methylobacterium sp. J-070]MCJ2050336.1 TetR/AcrR family transcriptional regulator [Methylobacterium sp. J-070]